MRWEPEEDAELLRAVDEHRIPKDKRNPAGIDWASIRAEAPSEYPLLALCITCSVTRVLQKRYFQYLRPEDNPNPNRIWR